MFNSKLCTALTYSSFCCLLICLCVLCNLMCIHVHVFVHTYVCAHQGFLPRLLSCFLSEGPSRTSILPMDPSLQAASGVPFLGRQDCKAGCLGEHMLQGSHTFAGECCGNWLPYALVISIVQPLHFLCQNSTVSLGCLAAETPSPSVNVNSAGPHISDLSSVSTQFPVICCFPNTPSHCQPIPMAASTAMNLGCSSSGLHHLRLRFWA